MDCLTIYGLSQIPFNKGYPLWLSIQSAMDPFGVESYFVMNVPGFHFVMNVPGFQVSFLLYRDFTGCCPNARLHGMPKKEMLHYVQNDSFFKELLMSP